jgi:hypothetical protein
MIAIVLTMGSFSKGDLVKVVCGFEIDLIWEG